MKRRMNSLPVFSALVGASGLAAAGSSVPAAQASPVRPNVLMIAVDDLNGWIAPMGGHPQARTPNFDRLAQRTTLFANAHAQAPLCGPSRASFFTGLYPSTSGIYLHVADEEIRKSNEASRTAIFLPEALSRHGYKTMGIGKLLHSGGEEMFDEFGGAFHFGPFPDGWPERRFRYEHEWTSTDWGAFPERDELMPDYEVASFVVERLGREYEQPFFLAGGFYRPHVPWYVPQKWFDLFPLETIITPPYNPNDWVDLPPISRMIHEMPATPSTEWLIERDLWREVVQAYLACVAFVDHQLGRILDALEASPYNDNTIIVLWSDHGYHLGEKNIVAKMTLWEESSNAPLFIGGPGLSGGQVSHRPVEMASVYPTLLEMLGLPPNPANDAVSLTPLLRNPDAEWEHPARSFWGPGNTSIRTDRYRYILYEDGLEELYDHFLDPQEWSNLAGQGVFRELKNELRRHIPSPQAEMTSVNFFQWNDYWRAKTEELDLTR